MQKGGGKTANSLAAKERSEIRKTYEKGHQALNELGELPKETFGKFVDVVSDLLVTTKKSSYHSFLHSFEYSLNKHLERVDEYRSNPKTHALKSQRIELTFLIEIHTDFSNMLLRDRKGVRKCPPGFMPMFDEVVNLLERASNRVDYIVLIMGSTIYGKETNVLALNGCNIRGGLKKQKVDIYEYVGEDLFLPEPRERPKEVKAAVSFTNNEVDADIILEWSDAAPECKCEAAFMGLRQVYEALQGDRCCASTFAVHFLSEIFLDKIAYWPDRNEERATMPQISMSAYEFYARYESFEAKWLER